MSILTKAFRTRMKYSRLEMIGSMILISLLINLVSIHRIFQCSSTEEFRSVKTPAHAPPLSTIERSRQALATLKALLNSVMSATDQPWIWSPSAQYPSVPYQPTSLSNRSIPRAITTAPKVPQVVTDEIERVCQRLNKTNHAGGEVWCKLFTKCYADTLATTMTLLDDDSTYIITGDIDLMWLRDSR